MAPSLLATRWAAMAAVPAVPAAAVVQAADDGAMVIVPAVPGACGRAAVQVQAMDVSPQRIPGRPAVAAAQRSHRAP